MIQCCLDRGYEVVGVCREQSVGKLDDYSSGTAQAVLDCAEPGARLIFSCGWHISKDGEDI